MEKQFSEYVSYNGSSRPFIEAAKKAAFRREVEKEVAASEAAARAVAAERDEEWWFLDNWDHPVECYNACRFVALKKNWAAVIGEIPDVYKDRRGFMAWYRELA